MTVVSVRYIQEGFYARFGIYSWEFPAGTSFSMVRSHLISGGLLPREAEARVSGCAQPETRHESLLRPTARIDP